jgi:hypothetical protein
MEFYRGCLVPCNVYLSDVLIQLSPHSYRTCETVLAWLLLHAPGTAFSHLSFWVPPGTSRQLGLSQVACLP